VWLTWWTSSGHKAKDDVVRENLMLGLLRVAGRGVAGISRKR